MAATVLEWQSIVQFRITIDEDGTPHKPEILGRFVTPMRSTKRPAKKKAPVTKQIVQEETEQQFF